MNSSSSTTKTKTNNYRNLNNQMKPLYETGLVLQRRNSLRNIVSSSISSPRNAVARFYFDEKYEDESQQPHFLDACYLCNKPLGDRDIFMYRGDTPFCSEECRQEQIEMDAAKEKNLKISSSMKSLRKKEQNKSSTSPNKTTFLTSTLAAA